MPSNKDNGVLAEASEQINIIKLLMDIKEDVASIKTDIVNFKETQKLEKEKTDKNLEDLRKDFQRDLEITKTDIMNKINNMQSVQNNLCGDVDNLKHADEKKDAKKWKTVMTYIGTSLGSMILVKLPDIIRTLMIVFSAKD